MIFQSRESREAALQGRLRSKFKVQEVVVHKKSTLDVIYMESPPITQVLMKISNKYDLPLLPSSLFAHNGVKVLFSISAHRYGLYLVSL